jgi:uncharacterized Zn-finger protein
MALHSGVKPFPCDQCEKSFPSKSYLNLHVYTIHDKRQRKTPAPPRPQTKPKSKPKKKPRPLPPVSIPIILEQEIPETGTEDLGQEQEVISIVEHEGQLVSIPLPPPYGSYYSQFSQQYPDSIPFQIQLL